MGRFVLIACISACVTTTSSAQTLTETFGSGANAFTMDFVTIGNPGNAADTTGSPNPAGSVAYTYNMGKYEVSREMIDKANLAGALGITMYDMISFGGNGGNKPATGISWYESAKFVNYLNTSSGGTAAYKFDASGNFQLWTSSDVGFNANNQSRNSLAKYFLPTIDELYKAAYGSPGGEWYNYATGSDSTPSPVAGGRDPNTAVYGFRQGSEYCAPADITNAGGLSAFGTMAQMGNANEWSESTFTGVSYNPRETKWILGGAWDSVALTAISSINGPLAYESYDAGLRVAMIPEPSSLSLLALGGVLVALGRRSRS